MVGELGFLPGAEGGFAGGNGFRGGGRIAELLKNPSGPRGLAVDEERGGLAQRDAAKIARRTVTFHAVQKRRDFDQLGASRHETVIDEGGGSWSGHGRRRKMKSQNRETGSKKTTAQSGTQTGELREVEPDLIGLRPLRLQRPLRPNRGA